LAIEDKYDSIQQLILMGKERGYLLYDEVNDLLPAEVHSSGEINDVLAAFEDAGIAIVEEAPKKPPVPEPAATSGGASRDNRRGRTRPHPRRARQNQRPRSHILARDG